MLITKIANKTFDMLERFVLSRFVYTYTKKFSIGFSALYAVHYSALHSFS